MILENSIYTYDINTRLVLTSFQGYKYRILKPQERSNIWIYIQHMCSGAATVPTVRQCARSTQVLWAPERHRSARGA